MFSVIMGISYVRNCVMKRKLVVLGITFGIIAIGALLALLVCNGLQIPCVFYQFTGLQCPGCGNTRATLALLRLDIKAMLSYNFLYPVQMVYLLYVYFFCSVNFIRSGRFTYRSKPSWIDLAFLFLCLAWAILRNCISFCAV